MTEEEKVPKENENGVSQKRLMYGIMIFIVSILWGYLYIHNVPGSQFLFLVLSFTPILPATIIYIVSGVSITRIKKEKQERLLVFWYTQFFVYIFNNNIIYH